VRGRPYRDTFPDVIGEASAAPVYATEGFYDEALTADGRPRPAYEEVLAALAASDLPAVAERTRDRISADGVSFGSGRREVPFWVDPVPRIFELSEWEQLERGILQRTRALNEFIEDVYGERRIVAAGHIPRRAIDGADHFEPWMLGVEVRGPHALVAGLDIVRGASGELAVLEDNLRTPSGFAYREAARRAVDDALPLEPPAERVGLEPDYELLGEQLRAAAPDGGGDPSVALLSDGAGNSAWYEHRVLASRLGIPIVGRSDLFMRRGRLHAQLPGGRERELQVIYRRTDEDQLRDDLGRATWLAGALLEPLRRGRLSVVNAFGTGVADDKLIHAYVEEMVRFYLGEEPLLPSVHTYDLGDPGAREAALGQLGDLVVKPRSGHGGHGVVVCRHATEHDRAVIARDILERPESFVAQETITLSRHPTVCGTGLEPRHVDLRAFVVGPAVVPGGLTRVALKRGALVVNSSQDGGAKDTWVVP
jgi:uncharacterized circularly permuted ATP-grasp superfamily protein